MYNAYRTYREPVIYKSTLGILLSLGWLITLIVIEVVSGYAYEKDYGSYWSLADRASTIKQKSEYVDKFVEKLEGAGLQGQYSALLYKTEKNSFDRNLEALKSLQARLREIQMMDVKSFEYQTAIQQITQQEQGEAKPMLDVFESVWCLKNYPIVWSWIGFCQVTLCLVTLMICIFIRADL